MNWEKSKGYPLVDVNCSIRILYLGIMWHSFFGFYVHKPHTMVPIDKDARNNKEQVKVATPQEESKKTGNFDKDQGKESKPTLNQQRDQFQNNNQPDNQNEMDTGTNIYLDDVFML
jgi:hypothetical protein